MTTVQDIGLTSDGEMAGADGFLGNFQHTLDSKKRLTVPAGWREMVGVPRRLYVLPGIKTKCLCVYPARDMLPRLENLRKNSNADARSQQFLRALASRSELVAWDAQGRIRIKDDLLAYASIENQVMLSGTFNKFDLWNPEQWKEQIGSIDLSTFEEDAARFAGY